LELLDSLIPSVIFSGMGKPNPDFSESRLLMLRANPEILKGSLAEDVYEDLARVDAALVAVRDSMDHPDPRFVRVYTSLADLRRTDKIGCDCYHIGNDEHQGAFEWFEERKAEAIKLLVPALALLRELVGGRTSQTPGE
jgi:hypothetical protein